MALVLIALAAMPASSGDSTRSLVSLGRPTDGGDPVVLRMIEGAGPTLSVLVGTTIQGDASGTQGNPSVLEWRITEPGGAPPVDPMDTGPTTTFMVGSSGTWHVEVLARYEHEAPVGTTYTSAAMADILAKRVVADLQVSSDVYDTEDDIFMDGSASTSAVGVTPTITWTQGAGPTPYGCGAELTCTIPPGSLDPGDYSFSLTLSDPVSGDVDTATAEFTVEEVPPLSVDFSWTPTEPDPGDLLRFAVTASPAGTGIHCLTWTWGDGNTDLACPCIGIVCTNGSHSYQVDGRYAITLDVTTSTGQNVTRTHMIEIGDPPTPPTADMSFVPASPTVLQDVELSMTGSCDAPCSAIWTFGDGAQSTEMAPTHAFDHHGTFTVQLALTNAAGSDSTSQQLTVGDCWSPPTPTQQGVCHGGDVILSGSGGTSYLWSTGGSGVTTTVGLEGVYWVSEADATGTCWGTAETTVVLTNCGDPDGDADLDGTVDVADSAALLVELTDGDGTAVVTSGGGDRTAPGGDATADGQLNADDLQVILDSLFASP
jgi:PKD repeat protein